RLVRRVPRAPRGGLRGTGGRGGDPPRPQRGGQDLHPQVGHGHGAAPARLGALPRRRADRAAVQRDRPARPRLLSGGARDLREPDRGGEPAAASGGAAGRARDRGDLRALPQPARAGPEPGPHALGRRAADARHRADPPDRRAAPAAGRADRGAGSGDRAPDRGHHPASQGRGLHDPAGRAELPLRGHGGRSPLRDGARAGGGHDPQRGARAPHREAPRVPRGIIARPTSHSTERKDQRMLKYRFFIIVAAIGLIAAPAARAQVSDGVIKIGVLTDMSSLYADLSGQGSVVAARMAEEDFGAAKKGMKVEIVSADHQNKADVGSGIARQWLDADKVDVIVDTPNSGVALAVTQIVKEKGKAFLVSGAASSDLTGKACSPNTIHWTYDTWALANGTGSAIVKTGGDSWFFLTADYAFGHALERDTEAVVIKNGGKVLGKVRHPLNTADFSSFLLQAQSSKAKIIGLANAGGDTTNAIKQAAEFGIVKGGQSLAGLL